MYNSIYPINFNYRNKSQFATNSANQTTNSAINPDENSKNEHKFPNGTKVAIDYSKGQINISQVITDFRSTLVAINAPQEVSEEVGIYLNLVEKESLKENPSKDIIVSNLRNASKISDAYIAKSLNKPSNVVEGWINALFMQKINLKANPNEINPDFLLEFPNKTQELQPTENQIATQNNEEIQPELKEEIIIEQKEKTTSKFELESNFETIQENYSENENISTQDEITIIKKENTKTPFSPNNDLDKLARDMLAQAKIATIKGNDATQALNLLNEALGLIANNQTTNQNIRAAIHFERGKIFNNYDYVDYALRDFWEASKADELNLKAQAFFKSGQIYDEFNEFSPALDGYLSSVAYSGEAENYGAQTKVLSKIASLYAKQFDIPNTKNYTELALDSALSAENEELLAQTYSNSAQNFQYLGENNKAIDNYKNALAVFSRQNESYEEMAYNYEQASIVMEKLGNQAKAKKLLSKANLYYQKAQLENNQQGVAS